MDSRTHEIRRGDSSIMHTIFWNIHHFRKLSIGTVLKHGTFTVKELPGCVFSLECHLVNSEEVTVHFIRCEGDDGPVEANVKVEFLLQPGPAGTWQSITSHEGILCRHQAVVASFDRRTHLTHVMLPSEVLTIVLRIRRKEPNEVHHPRVSEARTCVNVKRIKAKKKVDELLKEDRANPLKHKIANTEMYYQAKWGNESPPELRIEFGRSLEGQSRSHYFTAGVTLRDEYGRDQSQAEATFLFEEDSDALWLHPFNPGHVNSKGWELYFQLVLPDGTSSSQVMRTDCRRVSLVKNFHLEAAMSRLYKRPLPWDIMMVAGKGNDGYPIWEEVLEGLSDKMKAALDKMKEMREKKKISKDKFNAQVFEGVEGQTTTVALSKFDKSHDAKGGLRIAGPKLLVLTNLGPKSMRAFAQYLYGVGNELKVAEVDIAAELYAAACQAGFRHLHEELVKNYLVLSAAKHEEWVKRAATEARKLGDKVMKEAFKTWWQSADREQYSEKYRKLLEKVWS